MMLVLEEGRRKAAWKSDRSLMRERNPGVNLPLSEPALVHYSRQTELRFNLVTPQMLSHAERFKEGNTLKREDRTDTVIAPRAQTQLSGHAPSCRLRKLTRR